jgi:hypothetical protein
MIKMPSRGPVEQMSAALLEGVQGLSRTSQGAVALSGLLQGSRDSRSSCPITPAVFSWSPGWTWQDRHVESGHSNFDANDPERPSSIFSANQ